MGLLNLLESGTYNLEEKSTKIYDQVKNQDKITIAVLLKEFDAP